MICQAANSRLAIRLVLAGIIAVVAAGIVLINRGTAARGHPHRGAGGPPGERRTVPAAGYRRAARRKSSCRRILLSPLISAKADTPDEKRAQLHARLATVSRDPSQAGTAAGRIAHGQGELRPAHSQVASSLGRPVSRSASAACCGMTNRTRNGGSAALALADFIPVSEQAWWTAADLKFVAGQLVSSNAEYQPLLREALRPIRDDLIGDLEHLFADAQASDASDSAPPTRWPTLPGAILPGSPACSPSPPPSSSTCSTRSSRRAAHRQ